LKEFNDLVALLRENKVDVTVVEDTVEPQTPDAVFPNNWISFHEDGRVFLYPMFAVSRRLERKQHVLDLIKTKFIVEQVVDLSSSENAALYLEGTGSMVFDRDNKIAYACISPRTDVTILDELCRLIQFMPVTFSAKDNTGVDIYHTNVMMCIGNSYAVICLESFSDEAERKKVMASLVETNKEIIDISLQQLNYFAGNMLQVKNSENELLLIMSTQAYSSLTTDQIQKLQKYNRLLHSSLDTIEKAGGGSARCLMAEVFLTRLLQLKS